MSELLTKQEILAKDDFEYQDVEVPEWGGRVRVRALTGSERDQFESSIFKVRNLGTKNQKTEYSQENVRARLVAYSVVDKDGKRLFSESDIKNLGNKSAKALDRVFAVAQKLSGVSDEDVEEMSKN